MNKRLILSKDDRKCWKLFDKIDQNTLALVKFVKLHGTRLYAVLNDGRFIAAGKNSDGLLGVGHKKEVATFAEIQQLKNKQIKDIICGVKFVMVLTEDGQVLGWGQNDYGQMGEGVEKAEQLLPKRILKKDIVEVKSGTSFILARNKDGQVLTWGDNLFGQLGVGITHQQHTPTLSAVIKDVFIDKIEAGSEYSIAVSRTGKAYGWGNNSDYQLGLGHNADVLQPVQINIVNKSIKSVACSFERTLFLAEDGVMYVTSPDKATLTWFDIGAPIEHITSVNYGLFHVSYCALFLAWSSAKTYYWGDNKQGHELIHPIPTDLSVSQIILKHSQLAMFPTMLYMQQPKQKKKKTMVVVKTEETEKIEEKVPPNKTFSSPQDSTRKERFFQNVWKFFDSAELADIEFVFPDNRSIKAHRIILVGASEYMKAQLSSNWHYLARVLVFDYTYDIYHHYLSYLYSHTLSHLDDIDQLVSLVHLAKDFDEHDLEQVCEHQLSVQLNIENCSRIYELALKFNLAQLEKQASEMILEKIAQVRLTKGFQKINAENAKKLFYKL